MIELILYLILFLLYLLIQALFINGVFISAKGSEEKMPDGTYRGSEMILFPLYKFLNKSKLHPIYFSRERIMEIIGHQEYCRFFEKFETRKDGRWLCRIRTDDFVPVALKEIDRWAAQNLQCKIFYDSTTREFKFYKEEPVYRFSKYLRKPIITCVICMSSFWSIFLFLIPVIYLFGFSVKIFPIWIVNMFCLSYLNYVIFKPRK